MSTGSTASPLLLLVEDNENIRRAFSILLEDSGYRVLQAATGAEALELSRRDLPDLVLMDLGLPDLHGLEVTRRLKADPRTQGVLVLALTGRALEADRDACRQAGCAGYLSKPVDTAHLLRTIPELLGR